MSSTFQTRLDPFGGAPRSIKTQRTAASPRPAGAGAARAASYGHEFARIAVHDGASSPSAAAGASQGGGAGGVMQLARKKPLNPKQEAARARMEEKARQKAAEAAERAAERQRREARIDRAEQGFHEMFQDPDGQQLVGSDPQGPGLSPHHFPLDNMKDRAEEKEPIDTALGRLPAKLRKSDTFRRVLTLPDAAHGQVDPRQVVGKAEMQEALAGWQFGQETGLKMDTIQPGGHIDYYGRDANGREVPFDPFLSPSSGEGRLPNDAQKNTWARADAEGSYYKHTHSKGGDPNTVGVWDKTYTTAPEEQDLKAKLAGTGATVGAKVHELRVPLARMFAEEHVDAEDQIARRNEFRASVAKRYTKAQRGKPGDARLSFEEALAETNENGYPTARALHWRAELEKGK